MKLKLFKVPKTLPDLAFSGLKKKMPGTYVERENTAVDKEEQSLWRPLKWSSVFNKLRSASPRDDHASP